MKNLSLVALALSLSLSLFAADATPARSMCAGIVDDLAAPPPAVVPVLLRLNSSELDTRLDAFPPEQRSRLTVLIESKLDPAKDTLPQIEDEVGRIITWAKARGPFAAIGIAIPDAPAEAEAFAVKRLAVTSQGLGIAEQIAFGPVSLDRLRALFEHGALAYFDELVVSGDVAAARAWLAENDPAKQIVAIVPAVDANPIYDLAAAFAAGAMRAYSTNVNAARAAAALNRELASDYTYDPNLSIEMLDARGGPHPGKPFAFVRGEDLRALVVPPGNSSESTIIVLRGDEFTRPVRLDAGGARAITDTGKRGGRTLVGLAAGSDGFAVTLDRPKIDDPTVARETVDVLTERTITVEEILRNHQAWRAWHESIATRYIARNETSLRFGLGPGGDSFETTLAGDFFFVPPARADWVWETFLVNGVRWRYGRIPEIPILEPEKVTQLPLDIHLTRDYRYQLVRKTELRGFETYEVQFEPPDNAPESLPLYRGTVWIDAKSWARIRTASVQLNLRGEVLSNEERTDFFPFDRETKKPLSAAEALARHSSSVTWIPAEISAQQTFSVAGATLPVIRSTRLIDVQLAPEDFEARLQMANRSESRMVRETAEGLKYLERTPEGRRVVKDGTDTSRVFLLGGLYRDEGVEYGVLPLGGLDYFNYDLGGRNLQTNVFFAGVLVQANVTNPAFRGSRTNLGIDFFGIAVPFENTSYRDGHEIEEEAVRALPFNLDLRAGHPLFGFGKIDAQLGLSYISYQQAETTADDFAIPENTFEIRPSLEFRYDRRGFTFRTGYEHGYRTNWEPWGDPAEYSQDQEEYSRYSAAIGKSFYLPKFQRLGVEAIYVDGKNLDRFSKYELGFLGSERVRGIASGSVRAEQAIIGHLSYGFVVSDIFRMEAFYDHALIDDTTSGFSRKPFQGVGIGGQTIGPWGTILRLDIGTSIGPNRQDDIVANVVFLKLFG